MMNLVEFEENLREELEKHVQVITSEAVKYGYGKVKAFVLETDSNVKPVVYPTFLYKDYENGASLSEIVKSCVEILNRDDVQLENLYSTLQNKENMLDMIIPRVLHKESFYGDFYKTVPWSDDIIVAYYYEQIINSNKGSILLTSANMESLGISEKEVEEAAMKNLREKKFFISNLLERIFSLGEDGSDIKGSEIKYPMPIDDEKNAPMFVVMGEAGVFDANVLLRDDILQMLYEYLKGSYIIIPSSTHEIIVVPVGNNYDKNDNWSNMVSEVNDTVVQADEVLSYNSYIFNGAKIEQL